MRKPIMDANKSSETAMAGSHSSISEMSHVSQSAAGHATRGSRASSVTRADIPSEYERQKPASKSAKELSTPINAAVSSILGDVKQPHSIPTEVLDQITSQITANVLQQLRANSISTAPQVQPPTVPADPHGSGSSVMGSPKALQSPVLDRATVYTPPSPVREKSDTTSASPSHNALPTSSKWQRSSPPRQQQPSSPGNSSQSDDSDSKDETSKRPRPPQRISTNGDATTLEKCWGKLFHEGQGTERLDQFLRGIAVHIIQDYEPKNSLVITPEKMLKYYEETRLPYEYYPWYDIFDDKTSWISRMFRECQISHHLVQDDPAEKPDVPALTPEGFAKWMTLILTAQPDLEFDRLARTALHMPINNPDDPKERFPKELSRRLLPKESDQEIAQRLAKTMRKHCSVKLRSRIDSSSESESKTSPTAYKAGEAMQANGSNKYRPPYVESCIDRSLNPRQNSATERPNLPTIQSESVTLDDTDTSNSQNTIERERKPYVAQPGGGKTHDGGDGAPLTKSTSIQAQPTMHAQPPTLPHSHSVPPPQVKMGRSQSISGNGRGYEPANRGVPVAVHQQPPFNAESQGFEQSRRRNSNRPTRNRSPSITRAREYRRSENEARPTEYVRRSEPDIKPVEYNRGPEPGYNSMEYVRRTDPDIRSGNYHPDSNVGFSNSSRRPERYERERRQRGSISMDTKDRERERRPRMQSVSSTDDYRPYPNEEDAYRGPNPIYPPPDAYGRNPPSSTYRPY